MWQKIRKYVILDEEEKENAKDLLIWYGGLALVFFWVIAGFLQAPSLGVLFIILMLFALFL